MSAGDINLGIESLKGFSANLVQAAIGFIGTIVFARMLGPTSFGAFYFLLAIVMIVNRPMWGIGSAAQKRFSEEGTDRREVVGLLVISSTVMVGIAGLIGVSGVLGGIEMQRPSLVFFIILTSIFYFFPFQMMVGAKGYPGLATWIDTVRSVFTLPLQLLFVLLGFGAAGMGYGLAGATLLTLPITWYIVGVRPTLPTRGTIASIWEFARYSIPETFVGKAYDRFDVILLGALLTTAVVGQYEVASKLVMPALFVSGAISMSLFPKVSNLHSRNEGVSDHITNALGYASILSLPLLFGVLLLSQRITVTVYGPEYAEAAPFLIGLAVYKVIESQTSVLKSSIKGIDRPKVTLVSSACALTLNIVLGVLLVLTIGGIGVVIATVVAEFFQYVLLSAILTRSHDITLLPKPTQHQFLSGMVMLLCLYPLKETITIDGWFPLAVVVGIGGIVYFVSLIVLSKNFRNLSESVATDIYDACGNDLR